MVNGDANCVNVSVHNFGAPIPDEIRAAIFSPMTRGNTAGTKARGVGLGLFIVREVAKAHGGEATRVVFVNQQTADRAFPSAGNGLPVTDAVAQEVISLPMHPYLAADLQDRIIEATRAAIAG